ncbi:AAA family ATPase [Alicyclobacillus sendaiensis]|uniref:AAA family ATPase n=1 Tax=Alicyclobacillus sendaiensis TaxID=192387 RepID=UPI00272B1C5F|nr:P-loop NTPase [Alicyclobacillus sendaiensis]
MDYILVIPAGHSPVLAQAVEAWRIAPVEVAHNPGELTSITEEKGEPRMLVIGATMPNLVPNVAAMRKRFPSTKIIVAGTLTPEQLREIQADDVVRFPFPVGYRPEEAPVWTPMQAARTVGREETEKPMGKDRVVLVTSAKGGDGKTTVAMQLALWLAKQKVPVVVIDADYAGNTHEWLNVPNPAQSIAAFERDTPFDRAAFEGLLVARNGVKVLPHARVVTPDMLARAIRTAKAFYPVVIVDMHQGLTPQLLVAKDFATHLLIMTTASERRIPSTVQFVDEVKRYDTPAKLRVIVNRVKDEDEVRRVRAALEDYKTPILTLPFQEGLLIDDDPEFVPIAGSKGKDPYPSAFRKMAVRALDWEAPKGTEHSESDEPTFDKSSAKASKKPGFFASLFGGGKTKKPKKKGAKR